MKPGHEDCPHEVLTFSMWDRSTVYREIVCDHEHIEDIVADDLIGSGPTVGHHCHCCGRLWVDQDYVMKGQQ